MIGARCPRRRLINRAKMAVAFGAGGGGRSQFLLRTVGERDGAARAGGDWNSADVLAVLRQLADPERASVLLA